jgi:hypothetical protein
MSARLAMCRAAGFVVLLAGAYGCSGSADLGQFATVSGVVTHNGNPVEQAKVEFHGTTESAEGAKDLFSAYTDSSGKYMIAGVGKNPGIAPGLYKVVITKYIGKGARPGDEEYDPGQIEAAMSDQGIAVASLKNLLPSQYASVETSKLSVTVESGKNVDVNFDLKGR